MKRRDFLRVAVSGMVAMLGWQAGIAPAHAERPVRASITMTYYLNDSPHLFTTTRPWTWEPYAPEIGPRVRVHYRDIVGRPYRRIHVLSIYILDQHYRQLWAWMRDDLAWDLYYPDAQAAN